MQNSIEYLHIKIFFWKRELEELSQYQRTAAFDKKLQIPPSYIASTVLLKQEEQISVTNNKSLALKTNDHGIQNITLSTKVVKTVQRAECSMKQNPHTLTHEYSVAPLK